MLRLAPVVLLLSFCSCSEPSPQAPVKELRLEATEVGEMKRLHVRGEYFLGSQPSEADFGLMQENDGLPRFALPGPDLCEIEITERVSRVHGQGLLQPVFRLLEPPSPERPVPLGRKAEGSSPMGRGIRRNRINREGLVFQDGLAELVFAYRFPAEGGTPGDQQDGEKQMPESEVPSCSWLTTISSGWAGLIRGIPVHSL